MAQEYEIVKISENPPREWENPKGGTIYYIKVAVAGHAKPIEVGKKSPDALHVGDTIFGVIEPTDYPNDRFKPVQNLGHPGHAGGQPRDDAAIKAQFSIKAAIQALPQADATGTNAAYLAAVENLAKEIYLMVDRVKAQ